MAMLDTCTQGLAASKAAIACCTSLAVADSADAQLEKVIVADLPVQAAASAREAKNVRSASKTAASAASGKRADMAFPPLCHSCNELVYG
jgi:hypothetical protein